MNLKITNHAQGRIHERNVNIEHIKDAIRCPDEKTDIFDNRTKVVKEVEGKTIEVIYYKDGFKDRKEEYFIITAYYLNI